VGWADRGLPRGAISDRPKNSGLVGFDPCEGSLEDRDVFFHALRRRVADAEEKSGRIGKVARLNCREEWERGTAGDADQSPADSRIKDGMLRRIAREWQPMQKTKRADAISVENSLSYSVQIDATFGSRFQRSVAIKNLNSLLAAWKELVEAKHNKNAIRVIRSRD
jgi:hypothetical protein